MSHTYFNVACADISSIFMGWYASRYSWVDMLICTHIPSYAHLVFHGPICPYVLPCPYIFIYNSMSCYAHPYFHHWYAHIYFYGLICSYVPLWTDTFIFAVMGWYAHVRMVGLICSCTHVWASMLMYSCLGWYAHVLMFGLVCSCTHVWASMLMYSCLG